MEINEYLIKSFELMRSLENIDFFDGVTNLSRTEFHLLREVILEAEKGKNIISSELARRLGITRSAVSQIVTKMEQRGIVKRVAHGQEDRVYLPFGEHDGSIQGAVQARQRDDAAHRRCLRGRQDQDLL